ncbi:hypothetical protein [Nocardioides acrostichi]|uniref:Uncharacterized protein n=1 Tax=Nocardioides acrostichi TaxID=2784339 RepID=A0A930UZ35_9ACTN|nr:hypothetical protein [Nocardioides acrostichi]MBF4163548.1 hypothetical protein [Nocardioides acrostichi]
MSRHTASFDAYYLPTHASMDDHAALHLGLDWLKQQPGKPLIMLSVASQVRNSRELEDASNWAAVLTPRTRGLPASQAGAALVAWAHEPSLAAVARIRGLESVCAFGLSSDEMTTWIGGHAAQDLTDLGRPAGTVALNPVVTVAMEEMTRTINLNNELTTAEEKAYFVRTLQVLRDGGYDLDVTQLSTWAVAHGWGAEVLPRFRELAEGVRSRRQFRLQDPWGPSADALARWKAIAATGDA